MQNQEEDDGNTCETYVENKLHKYEHVLLLLLFFYFCSKRMREWSKSGAISRYVITYMVNLYLVSLDFTKI